MRTLMLIFLTLGLSVLPLWAQNYSCRDQAGRLHFSDNLQGLPDECRGREKVIKPTPADNLNFVPAVQPPEESSAEFERSVRDAERQLQQKQQRIERLEQQADQLSERYQVAREKKRQAFRSWSYGSREEIRRADAEMEAVRSEKQTLLEELKRVRMPQDRRARIKDTLAAIDQN